LNKGPLRVEQLPKHKFRQQGAVELKLEEMFFG
jgi:hypothetical protein